MKYRVLGTVAAAAAIAFAQPVAYLAQETGRAAEILSVARKTIGGGKLDALKTFSVQAGVQRNAGGMQLNSDVDIYLELPDKYARIENMSAGPGMVIAGTGASGFNGDRVLQKVGAGGMGGGMVIRMGGGGGSSSALPEGDKPTPEQLEQMKATALKSSKNEVSRFMLGWFAMAHPAANAEYTYLGEAESVEGKAYVLQVKSADGLDARLFIDEQTHLPLMVTYKGTQPRVMSQSMTVGGGGHVVTQSGDATKQAVEMARQPAPTVDYTVYFEDWRDADGLKFPFKMRRATEGNTVEEWSLSKAKVNPKIDPKKFAVDSGS